MRERDPRLREDDERNRGDDREKSGDGSKNPNLVLDTADGLATTSSTAAG